MKKILFVTGTDTGAGKTVLTALLLAFLRGRGEKVLAMKPFCSGSRADARLLWRLQDKCLTLDAVNPFYFDKPVAPAAAVSRRAAISLPAVEKAVLGLANRCDFLLVEGAGGLLAPLGKNYSARDLICRLKARVIVAGQNKLGVINHTLLTLEALQNAGIKNVMVVLMAVKKPDASAGRNPQMIRERRPEIPVFCLPYLGKRACFTSVAKENVKYLKKTLARLMEGR